MPQRSSAPVVSLLSLALAAGAGCSTAVMQESEPGPWSTAGTEGGSTGASTAASGGSTGDASAGETTSATASGTSVGTASAGSTGGVDPSGTSEGSTSGGTTTGASTSGGGSTGGAATCDDDMHNGGEEGVDCNGPCDVPCPLSDQQEVSDELPGTTGDAHPAVAMAPDGSWYVVAWAKVNQAGGTFHIRARLYDSAGIALGPSFAVADDIHPDTRQSPDVVAHDGGFVVGWMQNDAVDGWDVHVRAYDDGGTPQSAHVLVNTTVAGSQYGIDLASTPAGKIVACWGPGTIDCQRLTSWGTKVGTEVQIETTTAGTQKSPAVAMRADGSLLVVWQSCEGGSGTCGDDVADTGSWRIRGQLLDDADTPVKVGPELPVSATAEHAYWPEAAADTSGRIVATWVEGPWHAGNAGMGDTGPFTGEYRVQMQRWDATGALDGGVEQVTVAPVGEESIYDRVAPSVAANPSGGIVVTWRSDETPPGVDGMDIVGRRFAADGTPVGVTFLVQSTDAAKNTSGNQSDGNVAVADSGDAVFAWVGNQDVHTRAFGLGL